MTVKLKGKDFKRAVEFIRDFLAKLPKDGDCAELRDSLNLTLLHMKKYFQLVWLLNQDSNQRRNEKALSSSLPRGRGNIPFHQSSLDHFHFRWVNLEPAKVVAGSLPIEDDGSVPRLPLILQASKEGDEELVKQLVDKDPSCVNCQDDLGRSAIMYAVQFGSDDCLETLLKRGAHVNEATNDGLTAAHLAVIHEDGRTLRLLLEHGADMTTQDSSGRSTLHWAATLALDECLQILLKCNVALSPRDQAGLTPAMWACHYDRKQNFERLLGEESYHIVPEDHGIERDNRGRTWIHWSVDSQDQSYDCLKSLLSLETAAIQDSGGKTALHLAAEIGAFEACKVLLTDEITPSIINTTDNEGRTCLHLAVLGGHGEVANLLLEKGADLSLRDCHGNDAITYSEEKGLHYCTMILRSHANLHKRLPETSLKQSHQKTENRNREHGLSSQKVTDQPAMLFSSAPPPRPSLAPRLSNLTRVEDLDSEEVAGGHKGLGKNREENRGDGNTVQYVTAADGGIIHSEEMVIIGRDMQPSSQLAEHGDGLQTGNPPNPDSLDSNQSMDFGMDVSDIEENNNNEKGRLEGKSLEMIPPEILAQQPAYNPEMVPQTKMPRPPGSPCPNQQGPSETVQPLNHTDDQVKQESQHPLQPPSPRRLTPLSESSAVPQVRGELKSKKKKKKNSKAISQPAARGDGGRLNPEYPGVHPPVRPASPSFPLPSPLNPQYSSHTPLTRGRPERPSTPPPPPSWDTAQHSSPSPPTTPRSHLRLGPQETLIPGRFHHPEIPAMAMKGPQGPNKSLLSPVGPPSPRSPTAPLTPRIPPESNQGRGKPYMPMPPGGRSPRH